ncbi:ROK family protein [Agrobacterium sp. NPDC089420]|uniref:ROK family transcriptional regulator n=1 Tax=Agrobacterium sp. NPDC089420 TaxID=3363918 RepID=UPI00384D988B
MFALSMNQRRLIELILRRGEIARVDLAQLSGMTGASVTRLVGELVDKGLLTEEVERNGAQGQPRRLLRLKPKSHISAGITFSVSRMEIALIDLPGTVLSTHSVEIEAATIHGVADAAMTELTAMLAETNLPHTAVVGIGCSVPGNFGTDANFFNAHPLFPAFEDSMAIERLRESFELPCFVENDGTAASLGEYLFNRSLPIADPLFFIHIGHGVGGGAVIGGKPYRGANGNASLTGVLFPYDKSRPSGQDLLTTLDRAGFSVRDFLDIDQLPSTAQTVMDAWIERAGAQLRHAVRVASGLFDPAVIVIGGRLPAAINQALLDRILAEPIEGPSRGLTVAPVTASALGPRAGAYGAASIPFFETFLSGAVQDLGNAYLNGRKT